MAQPGRLGLEGPSASHSARGQRKRYRAQDLVGDRGHDGTELLALGFLARPFGVGGKGVPALLALGQAFPFQQVVKIVVVLAHLHRPEAGMTDAMFFPELERDGLEALEQMGQLAGQATVDAKFMQHGGSPERLWTSVVCSGTGYEPARAVRP